MKKFSVILEDNFEKYTSVIDRYSRTKPGHGKFGRDPILYFWSEQEALAVIDAIINHEHEPVKFILFIDGGLAPGCGSGLSFLNRAIDNFPSMIQEVVLISYSNESRREMQELCVENLIAVELLPLPFGSND